MIGKQPTWPEYSSVHKLVVSLYHAIQTFHMLRDFCLELGPSEAEQLAGDVAVHGVDEVLELVPHDLKLSDLQLLQPMTVLQPVEGLV